MTELYVRSAAAGELVVQVFDFSDFFESVQEASATYTPLLEAGLTLISIRTINPARVQLIVQAGSGDESLSFGVRARTPEGNNDVQLRILNIRTLEPSEPIVPGGSTGYYLIDAGGELLVTALGEVLFS